GEQEVQRDGVEHLRGGRGNSLTTGGHRLDAIAGLVKSLGQKRLVARVVLDYEDGGGGIEGEKDRLVLIPRHDGVNEDRKGGKEDGSGTQHALHADRTALGLHD